MKGHVCDDIESFSLEKFHQLGTGKGARLLIVGESPAPKGWIISGKACYTPEGKLLPTGKRLNELLEPLRLSVEHCGFTELSKCFVGKRTELLTCSKKCWPIFLKQLEVQDYELVILLGVHTTSIFSKIVGKTLRMGEFNMHVLNKNKYRILPIFHPSPINPTGHKKNLALFARMYPRLRKILQ